MTYHAAQGAIVKEPAERSGRRERWWRLMDIDVGIIPLPVYALLVCLLAIFVWQGLINGEIAMVIGIMASFAFTLGAIGNNAPVIRNIGGGAVLVTFVPSYLAYKGWIPPQAVSVVSDFFKSTNVLSLFIAAVIVGSILSMDRDTLIKGFAKIFVPLAAGSLVAALVGVTVGTSLGLGAQHTLFNIVVPIMAGGVGEGAIPLSLGYAGITGQDHGAILAQLLPAILVGNLTAIILAGALNSLGKRYPALTGNGVLQPNNNDEGIVLLDSGKTDGNVQNIAAAAMTAVTLYLTGVLAFKLLGFPAPVVMLFLAVMLKLAHGVSPRLQTGSYTVYKFCLTAVAYPMLFAFGVVLTPWDKLVAGFAPANLITIVATVTAMVVTGFITARFVNLHPVESAIVTGCHSGMGGAGDIAILSASNRMRLMPFAQIATRIGGGITVTLALLAMATLH
ncbi:2-hydroxycarboxylate transporter family protein [Rhizobium sp. CC-YZS058]|uniref:2-hydroxycarboxylate transporter family protein n=1 Tax=Rhizobium sp. CC-YZS058 TaxID=3042153 RepID=UPI002B058F41|nr:2-hydroxycarboxylate transporter family protein [Rhizobium sp. CC-YZS058]MEA3537107.1 2-hydroxycarboxylate transporter family protein [Rhizobium sp. CC-YZS058]